MKRSELRRIIKEEVRYLTEAMSGIATANEMIIEIKKIIRKYFSKTTWHFEFDTSRSAPYHAYVKKYLK